MDYLNGYLHVVRYDNNEHEPHVLSLLLEGNQCEAWGLKELWTIGATPRFWYLHKKARYL